jgi:hypothetical protein
MFRKSGGWAHSLRIGSLMKRIFPVFRMQGDRVIGFWVVMRTGTHGNGAACTVESDSGEDGRRDRSTRLSARDCERLFDLIRTAKIELEHHMVAASIRKKDKQDLLASLPRILQSYRAFAVSRAFPFRVAINHIICNEAATRCSIHLTSEELLALWREVR